MNKNSTKNVPKNNMLPFSCSLPFAGLHRNNIYQEMLFHNEQADLFIATSQKSQSPSTVPWCVTIEEENNKYYFVQA